MKQTKMGKVRVALYFMFLLMLFLAVSVMVNMFLIRNNINVMNNVYLNGESVKITAYAQTKLDGIYAQNLTYEKPVCLGGSVTNEGIFVEDIYAPVVVESNETSVTYVRCPFYIGTYRTIGTLHNHPKPNNLCRLSDQDIRTYVSDTHTGQTVIGIYCGRYTFFVLSMLESETIQTKP